MSALSRSISYLRSLLGFPGAELAHIADAERRVEQDLFELFVENGMTVAEARDWAVRLRKELSEP